MSTTLLEGNDLVDRVDRMGKEAVIDEFGLQQIAADACKLMPTDAASAHAVLGRVAALRWDVAELRRHYRSAISLGDPVLGRWRYSMALFLVGETEESFEVVRDAWQRAPDNLDLLDELIATAVHSARFQEAQELCDHRRKLASKGDLPLAPVTQELVRAVQQGHFSEEGAREALRAADSIRRDARIRPNGVTVVPSWLDPGSFLYEYRLIASPKRAGDLNEALSLRWAESPLAMADPGLEFLPIFIGMVIDVRCTGDCTKDHGIVETVQNAPVN